jgi:predicted NACHT family NTPase
LILNTLQNRYGVHITQSTFYELQRLGKFIFLFDGFDEMDARANPETISSNLRELNKILDIKENKFILTCRTHFFRNRVQVEVLEDFKMLYIPEWGEIELKEYLQKKFGQKWKEYLMRITGTYNLQELAQTPLFLDMIAETLPKLGDHVKRIELYKAYTDKWIKNQTKHKGALLSTEERRSFIKELAIKLYSENRFFCHYSELIGILKMYFQRIQSDKGMRFIIEDVVQLDHLRHDVQTCTFLTRNTSGDYSFKHTSFLEFFVAQTLAEDLEKGIVTYLENIIIPITIREFFVGFSQRNDACG